MGDQHALEVESLSGCHVLFGTLATLGRPGLRKLVGRDAAWSIVDEAAQPAEAETLCILNFNPKKLLLVGDPKQLAATVVSKAGTRCNFDRSLMYRLMNAGQSFGMLRSQYRMHPQIARFPSACFYRGQLESAGPTVRMPRGASLSTWNGTVGALPPYVVVDTSEGGESRWDSGSASCSNQCEAHLALRLAEALAATRGDDEGHICILSFYQGQAVVQRNGCGASETAQQWSTLRSDCGLVPGKRGRYGDLELCAHRPHRFFGGRSSPQCGSHPRQAATHCARFRRLPSKRG